MGLQKVGPIRILKWRQIKNKCRTHAQTFRKKGNNVVWIRLATRARILVPASQISFIWYLLGYTSISSFHSWHQINNVGSNQIQLVGLRCLGGDSCSNGWSRPFVWVYSFQLPWSTCLCWIYELVLHGRPSIFLSQPSLGWMRKSLFLLPTY